VDFADRAGVLAGAAPHRARAAGVVALAGLGPALGLFAPASNWGGWVTLGALSAIALVSFFATVAIRPSTYLDAGFVAALLALAFLGPLPAFLVWLVAEAAFFFLDRHRIVAHLANVASYGWAALVGALVFGALGPERLSSAAGPAAYLALGAAGIAMLVVNFAVTRGIVAVLLDGRPLGATIGEVVRTAPATVLMIGLGAATAFLYTEIGILALALFAALVAIPQVLLPLLLRARPVSDLEHSQAAAMYALALAHVLELGETDRLVLKDACAHLRGGAPGPPEPLSSATAGYRLSFVEAVLFHRESWDCRGGAPGAVGGEMVPLVSRVLAVADAWAGLTASGSPRLTHSQALIQLESRADVHFDPAVVAAAARVVEGEGLGLHGVAAYPPRLHTVRLPRLAAKLRSLAEGVAPAAKCRHGESNSDFSLERAAS
jgi:hypothetical protein